MENFIIILLILIVPPKAFSQAYQQEAVSEINPNDYLYGSFVDETDTLFEQGQSIELGVDLSSGSDCGRINLRGSLRGSLKNLLDADYFGDLGKNILAASPMLATCYFSPTWCSILKSFRANANVMLGSRLKQCSLIEKYTDSRVQDYQEERQRCVQKAIQANGGNAEEALDQCQGGNLFEGNLPNWAGGSQAETGSNKLIDSSAKWANLRGADANKTLSLIKSMVGDTVITKGRVSVNFGRSNIPTSPRIYLSQEKEKANQKLCGDILARVVRQRHQRDASSIVTDSELKDLSKRSNLPLIDLQTLRSLSSMPYKKRAIACRKLADALATSMVADELNKSLDVLTTLGQNPNLSKNRRDEINSKRRMLRDSIELTLTLNEQKNAPLNSVLAQINKDGRAQRRTATARRLGADTGKISSKRTYHLFNDCSDWVMCGRN